MAILPQTSTCRAPERNLTAGTKDGTVHKNTLMQVGQAGSDKARERQGRDGTPSRRGRPPRCPLPHRRRGRLVLQEELDELHRRFGRPFVMTEFGTDTLPGQHASLPAHAR